jgi:hypothetical protein
MATRSPRSSRWAAILSALLGAIYIAGVSRGEEPPDVQASGAPYRFTIPDVGDDGVLTYWVESEFQDGRSALRVVLPPDGRATEAVLFMLPVEPGLGQRWGDGLVALEGLGARDGLEWIIVAPSFERMPWYADHPADRSIRQESYMLRVVVPLVDELYPSAGRRRLLLGFSKSGWGALSLLLRHPDVFDAAAVWDAPLMLGAPTRYGAGEVFGTQECFEEYRISELLPRTARLLGDRERIGLLGHGSFPEQMADAHRMMTELGIEHHYIAGPPREHHWSSGWVADAVDWLAQETWRGE